MANGLPNPKEALRGVLSLPRSIETSLPQGSPQISSALSNIIDALPDIAAPAFSLPTMPAGFPALPTGLPTMPAGANGITDFIKGIESTLPQGAPSFSQSANQVVNGIRGKTVIGTELETAPANAFIKIGL